MTAHKQIVAAREYMATHGMTKGVRFGFGGDVCLLGAFDAVTSDGSYGHATATLFSLMTDEERRRAEEQWCQAPPSYPAWLAQFNNHPDTTIEDVLALFDRGAAATAPVEEIEPTRELALA